MVYFRIEVDEEVRDGTVDAAERALGLIPLLETHSMASAHAEQVKHIQKIEELMKGEGYAGLETLEQLLAVEMRIAATAILMIEVLDELKRRAHARIHEIE